MSEVLANFGRNLHIILYDKKMSNTALAQKIGVSSQIISAYTTGVKTPSLETLIKISNALGVTVDELVR